MDITNKHLLSVTDRIILYEHNSILTKCRHICWVIATAHSWLWVVLHCFVPRCEVLTGIVWFCSYDSEQTPGDTLSAMTEGHATHLRALLKGHRTHFTHCLSQVETSEQTHTEGGTLAWPTGLRGWESRRERDIVTVTTMMTAAIVAALNNNNTIVQ